MKFYIFVSNIKQIENSDQSTKAHSKEDETVKDKGDKSKTKSEISKGTIKEELVMLTPAPTSKDYSFFMEKNECLCDLFDLTHPNQID